MGRILLALPPELLAAITAHGGGRVVMIIGAGCSLEPPTSLPLSKECAIEVHRRLRLDGILTVDCANPGDLSEVADAVFAATSHQRPLVERLNLGDFRSAEPNAGYKLAAALLSEQALSCVMTLNFDLAMSTALSLVGARDVSVIAGPHDHHHMGVTNVIYLHRNVDADAEEWILRTASLAVEWQGQWTEAIAQRFLNGPVAVFAGLGTPAAVLTDGVRRLRAMLPPNSLQIYQVDPADMTQSPFFAQLGIPTTAYVRMGWVEFMEELSARVAQEQIATIRRAAADLAQAEQWEDAEIAGLCARIVELGLLRVGRLRAQWLLDRKTYRSQRSVDPPWIAKLLMAIALIEHRSGSEAQLLEDGMVEFRRGNTVLGTLIFASGHGVRTWLALETDIRHAARRRVHWGRPRWAVVAGVDGGRPQRTATPENVAGEDDPESIVVGDTTIDLLSVDELRQGPIMVDHILV